MHQEHHMHIAVRVSVCHTRARHGDPVTACNTSSPPSAQMATARPTAKSAVLAARARSALDAPTTLRSRPQPPLSGRMLCLYINRRTADTAVHTSRSRSVPPRPLPASLVAPFRPRAVLSEMSTARAEMHGSRPRTAGKLYAPTPVSPPVSCSPATTSER